MYLTRAVLDKHARAAALAPLLDPPDPNRALDAHHRLMWMLFPGKNAERDFLWRADGDGRFYILSQREPVQSDLFLPLNTAEFKPVLAQGDRLSFGLRANATKDRRVPKDENGSRRNRRVDLVMDTLYGTPGQKELGDGAVSERPAKRMETADRVASEWLAALGQRTGFDVERLQVENYSVRRIFRGERPSVTFGLLDVEGILKVKQPDSFLAALAKGFGRARAFGCGLMLIRRA